MIELMVVRSRSPVTRSSLDCESSGSHGGRLREGHRVEETTCERYELLGQRLSGEVRRQYSAAMFSRSREPEARPDVDGRVWAGSSAGPHGVEAY